MVIGDFVIEDAPFGPITNHPIANHQSITNHQSQITN
jgi:hypothetical protein